MKIPPSVKAFARVFYSAGHSCFLVGGAVRDMLMGRELTDFDIATDATPQQVTRLFRRVIPTGIKHGTVTVLFRSEKFEVTTFRVEDTYSDRRRPDAVRFSPSILEDLQRRDFTINGIAYDLRRGRLIDPHGGRKDLERGLIRAIGDPSERLREDALRCLRGCRFAAGLGFRLDGPTFEAIRHASDSVLRISKERVRDELVRIVQSQGPVYGFELLRDTDLLPHILPELHACIGVPQRELHAHDVFYHSLHCCEAAPRDKLVLRLAALLHDVGKAETLFYAETGEPRFHGHDTASARLTASILRRLKFPNAVIQRVSHLVRHHMFGYQEEWSDAAVRRFVARVGSDSLDDLFQLRMADQAALGRGTRDVRPLLRLRERIDEIMRRDAVFSIQDLAVDGNDIMERLGIPPGPEIGVILRFLLETVLEDPEQNTPETLLKIAERFYRDRVSRR